MIEINISKKCKDTILSHILCVVSLKDVASTDRKHFVVA